MKLINPFASNQLPDLETRTSIKRISITEDGKYKLSKLEVGSIEYRILDAVNALGMCNIDEIKERTKLDKVVLKHHIIELDAQGYLQLRKTIQ